MPKIRKSFKLKLGRKEYYIYPRKILKRDLFEDLDYAQIGKSLYYPEVIEVKKKKR